MFKIENFGTKLQEKYENKEGITLNYHNKIATNRLCFLPFKVVAFPIKLRTKLDESPFYVRYYSGGSSSLVRKIKGGILENEQP